MLMRVVLVGLPTPSAADVRGTMLPTMIVCAGLPTDYSHKISKDGLIFRRNSNTILLRRCIQPLWM